MRGGPAGRLSQWVTLLVALVATVGLTAACGVLGGDDASDRSGPAGSEESGRDGGGGALGELADEVDGESADGESEEADGAGAPGGDATLAGPIEAEFTSGECGFELDVDVDYDCGTVTVPEDWSEADRSATGSIDLTVAVFSATTDDPEPDPVVYLEGGPGGHALEPLQFSFDDLVRPLLASRDVIVFDQRGAGLSEPRLACTEVEELSRRLEDIPDIDDDDARAELAEALEACRDRLIDAGIDLDAYNSINNAHDVEAIRVALGYDSWNLFGISYGTRLGLEVLRRHPDGVRSAVLDSVFPPDVNSVAENPQTFVDSYNRVIEACAAEAVCAAEGDLGERLAAQAQRLEADPVQVEITDWISAETDEVYADGDALVSIVTQGLYSPAWFSDLPELVSDLEAGNTDLLIQFLSQMRTTERFFTGGMFFAFGCHEEIVFAEPDEVDEPEDPFGLRDSFELASNVGLAAFETCAAFENGRAPEEANQAVTSDVEVLLMAGAYDPVTPVAWAQRAAETLPNSQLVVGPHQSHGVAPGDCGLSIVTEFLDDPGAMPDDGCLADEPFSFLGSPEGEVELVEASYAIAGTDQEITTVRPAAWTVGSLGGDQYRQRSFLDPTQLFQLAGPPALADSIRFFLESNLEVSITGPAPVEGPIADAIASAPVDRTWQRRTGQTDRAVVEWYESNVDEATVLLVVLVSTPDEVEDNLSRIVAPALATMQLD